MTESTLCYIERDGKYLMLFRNKKKNDMNEGKWLGIGGKFEEGEDDVTCVLREVKEETGLTLTKFRKRGVVDFSLNNSFDERMHLFTATEYSGTVVDDCNEGQLKWIDIDKVTELPLWEGDKIFLRKLTEGESDFYISLSYIGDKLVEVKYE